MSRRDSLSPTVHTGIGAAAGMLEVCIMQPTVAIKNALQEGRPMPTSPLAYYRGLLVNVGSMAPITAIQFGAHRAFEQSLQRVTGEATDELKILSAALAGGTSSAVGCPAELLMIQQQKSGRSLVAEAKHYISQHSYSKLYRGLAPTATRDSLFTACYLGLCPALTTYVDTSPTFASYSPTSRFLLSAIASGSFGALVTQPVDTIKTRMQAFVNIERQPEYTSMRSTARHLIQINGVFSLWAGIAPRLFRLSGATIILQLVRDKLIEKVEEYKGKS